MAEQGTFVRAILLGQISTADLAARVRHVPTIPLRHLPLVAEAEVILRYEETDVPAGWALPTTLAPRRFRPFLDAF